jgi:hypothetical protein
VFLNSFSHYPRASHERTHPLNQEKGSLIGRAISLQTLFRIPLPYFSAKPIFLPF